MQKICIASGHAENCTIKGSGLAQCSNVKISATAETSVNIVVNVCHHPIDVLFSLQVRLLTHRTGPSATRRGLFANSPYGSVCRP